MRMECKIRKMKKKDIPQVQQIAKTSWNHTYEGIIPFDIQEKFLQKAYNDERMQQRLEHSLMLVSEADGKIVGFANYSFVREGGVAYLAAVYLGSGIPGKRHRNRIIGRGDKPFKGSEKDLCRGWKRKPHRKKLLQGEGFWGCRRIWWRFRRAYPQNSQNGLARIIPLSLRNLDIVVQQNRHNEGDGYSKQFMFCLFQHAVPLLSECFAFSITAVMNRFFSFCIGVR